MFASLWSVIARLETGHKLSTDDVLTTYYAPIWHPVSQTRNVPAIRLSTIKNMIPGWCRSLRPWHGYTLVMCLPSSQRSLGGHRASWSDLQIAQNVLSLVPQIARSVCQVEACVIRRGWNVPSHADRYRSEFQLLFCVLRQSGTPQNQTRHVV